MVEKQSKKIDLKSTSLRGCFGIYNKSKLARLESCMEKRETDK